MTFLSGYKTYVVGIAMIILGIYQNWDTVMILNGLAILSGRAAIAKLQ
jgi:hypothetical protein